MSTSFAVSVQMVPLVCCHANCGMTFAVPEWFEIKRRQDHALFHCPNGHSQSFGDGPLEKLKRQIEAKDREIERKDLQAKRLRDERDAIDRSRRAIKGVATRRRHQLDKVAAGVCPCCDQAFDDLRQHIADAHPHFAGEGAELDGLAGIVQDDDKTA